MKNLIYNLTTSILIILFTISIFSFYKATTINLELGTDSPGKFQIFWRNASENFSESKSQILHLQKSSSFKQVSFDIPTQDIFEIRIDPIDCPGNIEIHNLKLAQGLWHQSYSALELSKISLPIHQVQNQKLVGNSLRLESIGTDPQILVKLNPIPKWNLILGATLSLLLLFLLFKFNCPRYLNPHAINYKLSANFLVIILLITAFFASISFKLHGSSIHSWYSLYPNLFFKLEKPLLGEAKSVRSDEWLVHTPAIISQSQDKQKFSISNPSYGYGQAPMLMGLPTNHITTVFRPQYWGFFIFEIERAYAWWWSYRVFGCLLGVYLLTHFLVRGKTFLAITASIWFYYSAFVQWWLSSGVPELVASFSLALFSLFSLLTSNSKLTITLYGLSLLLFGLSFTLQIYPPFQIPLIWLGLALTLGVSLSGSFRSKIKPLIQLKITTIVIVAIVASISLFAYFSSIKETALVLSQTAYPGERVESGGHFGISRFFSGFAAPTMSQSNFPSSYGNISETSSFYFIWPISLVCLMLSGRFKLRSQTLPLSVLLISLTLYVIIGWPQFISNITLMKMVPSGRALIAIGLGGIIFCMMTLGAISRRTKLQIVSSLCLLITFCIFQFYKTESDLEAFFNFPEYIISFITLLLLSIPLIFKKSFAFCIAAIVLVLSSSANINPLVRGLKPLLDNKVSRSVEKIPYQARDGKWLVFGDFILPSLFKSSGVNVLNGAQYVPQLDFWQKLDPNKNYWAIYNRYAHFQFTPTLSAEIDMKLHQADLASIVIDPCHPSLLDAGITTMVLPSNLNPSCLDRIETPLDKEGIAIYIRKENKPSA